MIRLLAFFTALLIATGCSVYDEPEFMQAAREDASHSYLDKSDLTVQNSNAHRISDGHDVKPKTTLDLGSKGPGNSRTPDEGIPPIITNKGGVLVVQVVELEQPKDDPKVRHQTISAFKKKR